MHRFDCTLQQDVCITEVFLDVHDKILENFFLFVICPKCCRFDTFKTPVLVFV